tara:strand:+ start:117 stop:1982 length:1866 start_codon:yes stop_codon:yes gene_type:complete
MFQTKSEWAPPSILPDLTEKKEIAIDLETRDPSLIKQGPGWATGNGEIVGISLATNDWFGYLPIRHQGGGNLDKSFIINWLSKQLNTPSDKIFHNALYDVGWLKREGIELKGKIQDTMIAAPLINENRNRYSLDSLGAEYCKERKDETLLKQAAKEWGINPKSEMWKLPAKYVGLYAEQDAALTLKLWNEMKPVLDKQNLNSIYELESGLLPLLIEMRWRGILIDQDKAGQTSEQLKQKEKQALKEIKAISGVSVEIWASASVAKAFDKLNIKYPRTIRTNAPSFTSQWLENHTDTLPQAIVKARKLNKIRTTFIDKMIFEHLHNGRIHGQLHPLRSDNGGTVTGRFSYSTPNLQQVPVKDPELGRLVRELFIPDDNAFWGTFDYSQQEPRLTVHYSSLTKQLGAQQAVEEYQNEEADFHQIVADMAGIDRKKAKMINLGLSYGMGRQKLTMSLGISEVEAEQLFARYHKRVPFIRGLTNACMRKASNKGFITTLLGRRCRFNLYEPQGERGIPLPYDQAVAKWGERGLVRAYTYKALNRLIQGSAADMTKRAMLDLWKEGYVPYVQVHDELDLGISTKKETEQIKEIMENCVKLQVPNIVDIEIGKSWGTAIKSYQEVFK